MKVDENLRKVIEETDAACAERVFQILGYNHESWLDSSVTVLVVPDSQKKDGE
jgi:hypothetical protein